MAAKKSAPKTAAETSDSVVQFADMTAFADAARDQYETALAAFTENAEKIRAQTEEQLASARESFEAAGERLRAVSADTLAQARSEMTDAVDFANELARAKSAPDALEIQRRYWTKLFETRVERARALSEASVEAAREVMKPMSKSLDAAFAFTPAFSAFFPFATK